MIAKNQDGSSVPAEDSLGAPGWACPVSQRGPGRPKGSKNRRVKKKKPYRSFPLTLHGTGQYCKKIRGKIQYFGTDPDIALQRYQAQCEDLHSGRVTSVDKSGGLTIGNLVNKFLTDAKTKQERGEIAARTFMDYYRDCERLVMFFRTNKNVEAITEGDLLALRAFLGEGVGLVTLHGRLGVTRSLFTYAWDKNLIPTSLRLKTGLRKPSLQQLRKARHASGRKYFTPAEVRNLLDKTRADATVHAMILLGINCGLGNTDIASLSSQSVDLEGGWLDFPRIKTGVERRCPLWPETVTAIRNHIKFAKEGGNEETKGLLFVTRKGHKFVRSVLKETKGGTPRLVEHDVISQRFKKVMKAAGIDMPGVAFYGLRKSCETFGAETGEQVAVDHIMGHAPSASDMATKYRGYVAVKPLRRVTNYIRGKVLIAPS